MAEAILAFACVLITLAGVWGIRANEITHRQRQEILDWVFAASFDANYGGRLHVFKSVSYDQHFWAVFLFKDWHSLYLGEAPMPNERGE